MKIYFQVTHVKIHITRLMKRHNCYSFINLTHPSSTAINSNDNLEANLLNQWNFIPTLDTWIHPLATWIHPHFQSALCIPQFTQQNGKFGRVLISNLALYFVFRILINVIITYWNAPWETAPHGGSLDSDIGMPGLWKIAMKHVYKQGLPKYLFCFNVVSVSVVV